MSNIIEVENLGKKYILGQHLQTKNFREHLVNKIKSFFSSNKIEKLNKNEFWALKNLSFKVKQGERIGIIGKNGAGKSTALKLLSRITEPTEGKIILRGRTASLLEVGTGFHGELTGRENIFLNGSILGMTKNEIKRKFDEIVGFAGTEKFLDTPIKRYSSGMFVRLAFAVAAHLEPEILIVDEVLAVGDAEFQKKSLGKMQDVSKQGRTVLFVSHNMSAVESLCERVIVLDSGRKVFDGETKNGIDFYLTNAEQIDNIIPLHKRTDRGGNGKVRVVGFKVLDKNKIPVDSMLSGEDYFFEISYKNNYKNEILNVITSIAIHDKGGNIIIFLRSNLTNHRLSLNQNSGKIFCYLNNLPLGNGTYYFTIFLSYADIETLDDITNVNYISVEGGDFFGTGHQGYSNFCKILTIAEWK